MLTLRKTQFTFVALNQCGVTLAGTAHLILYTPRYTELRHLRVVESINKRPGQGISLNNSTDDGVFVSTPHVAKTTYDQCGMVYNTLNLTAPRRGLPIRPYWLRTKTSKRGGATSSSLSTDRKRMTDGRLNEFLSKNLIISSKWGIFRGKLLSPSLNFIPSGSR